MSKLGIYIHWPYCISKCPYCDFNSHKLKIYDYFYKVIGRKGNKNKDITFSEIKKSVSTDPSNILSVGDDFDDYFQSVSIEDRLKKYVKAGGLPSDFVDRYAKDKSSKRV